jgi:STAM-binding protein
MNTNLPPLRFKTIADLVSNTAVEQLAAVPTPRLAMASHSLFEQAETHALSKNWEQAYFLYIKAAQLFVEQLRKRPDYARLVHADSRTKLASLCARALTTMERIKPKLELLYKAQADADARAAAQAAAAARAHQTRADSHASTMQLAEMEALERRLLAIGAKPDELPSSMPAAADAAPPVYANLSAPPSDVNSDKHAASAPATVVVAASAATAAAVAVAAASYPTLTPSAVGNAFVPTATAPPLAQAAAPMPSMPPMPIIAPPPGNLPAQIVYSQLPPIASPPAPSAPPADALPPTAPVAPPPAEAAQRKIASMAGTNIGFRPMVVDDELLTHFMQLVQANTAKGIETCGILTGKLETRENDDGVFNVTHLILPRQKGTQNTCEMVDEDTLLDYQMKNDLMTLGWIHTHPTQSCFMSSVDLHTHLGYQLMLPEAVAIVMAPSDIRTKVGVFMLSEVGLEVIKHCKQKSFHVHSLPDKDIYSNAAHCRFRRGRPIYQLIDFR